MTSWVRTITSPFKKARTFFNQQQPSSGNGREKSQLHHQQSREGRRTMDLHSEVMACTYEDVQVMWSILGKSRPTPCNITS